MLTSTSSFKRDDDDEKEAPPSSLSLLHPNAPVKVTLRVRGEGATKNTRERAGGKWTSDQFALGLLSFASTTAEAFRSRGETTTRTRKIKTKRKDGAGARGGHFTSGRGVFWETNTGTPTRESHSPRANVASSGGRRRFIFRPGKKGNESFDESSTLLAKKTVGGRCRALERIF